MSDDRNRDLGRKRERQKHRRYCDCWLCLDDAVKKRRVEQRADKKEIQRSLGYSRIGRDNI